VTEIKTIDTCEQIFSMVYEKYLFLELSRIEIEKINMQIIAQLESLSLSAGKASHYVTKKSYDLLNQILISDINNINAFLSETLTPPTNLYQALKGLLQIKTMLSERLLLENFDFLNLALKNNEILNQILSMIVNGEKEFILSRYIDISDDTFFISLFEMYCSQNNINQKQAIVSYSDVVSLRDEESFVGPSEDMLSRDIQRLPLLTPDEEKIIIDRVKNGDMEAEKILVERNIRLVIHIAGRIPLYGVEISDVIQEGTFGLKIAAKKYDPELGCKFSTYAHPWIQQVMTRYINRNRKILKTADGFESRLINYRKSRTILENKLHRFPTLEEIAEYMSLPLSTIREYEINDYSAISINQKIGEDGQIELSDLIADKNISVEDEAISGIFSSQIFDLIKNIDLPPIYKIVIYLRFGLIDGNPILLGEIGARIGFTRQRADFIFFKAIERMRESPEFQQLKGFGNADFTLHISCQDTIKEAGKLTFRDLFIIHSETQLTVGLLELNEEERIILKNKFGENLDDKVFFGISPEDKEVGRVINKLRICICRNIVDNKVYRIKHGAILEVDSNVDYKEILKEESLVRDMLETVDETSKIMLYLRLGFVNGKSYTIESIGLYVKKCPNQVKKTINRFVREFKQNSLLLDRIEINDDVKIYKKSA